MKIIRKQKRLKVSSRIPRKLKWGVAGCGNFTEKTFLPAFQMLKRSKLVSVYSSNIDRAKSIASKFSASEAFDKYEQFLKSDIEAVYIGSINSHHYKQVIKAAKAGKHILCDKPLALNSKQVDEMVKECKKNNVFLTINHTSRFHPLIIKAKELISNQILGKIISIDIHYNIDLPPGDNFRFKNF